MATINSTIFNTYAIGTAFWYALRGLCRIYDPEMVVGWFRPPSQAHLRTNDLELYNVRNDGWCLITLALILLGVMNAGTSRSALPYAKAVVAATIFHHVTTGFGAYQHYKLESHYNTSMAIGVWGNVWLAVTGVVTLGALFSGTGEQPVEHVIRKTK